ncbi:MAG: TIGR03087 family PEP-CTERM/XrtA system glycosyltransferase [Candidatus Nitrotoga sp.]|nr:TIGR03087 family PEP-CTERM/XrtA system glycosyltransferase [Candidatus Nitrotoga sp.]MDO9446655.1 TIGR03087 family PEP-CTERM/XrtA system glycosyltransferase [Candidatus Nitrotoga sp.]MDP1639271.1 TIGR03087 family PEP-CTERM/XrtA system glycosyltransferase [Candidatus Nitrotoga sp.]MDP1855226.1 TIGR03087 family PEP-CTERM/XrtA system glycosyltransferase [Candidatus Nitrotoga sp.]MDP3497585.1 TIGR03087 family PEP-CTERM/XrtA system glycosyltransferase [Candidatus Nitrotoga sp.]
MDHLLYLTHRIPYPPNKGDKIRSYHLLKYLAQHYHVHLGTFIDDPDDWQYIDTVKQLCGDTHFASLNPRTARLRSLRALIKNRPLTLDYYSNNDLQEWVRKVIKKLAIKRVLIFSSAMAQYLAGIQQARCIIDFVDIDSDKWRQYATRKPWPMSWLYQREGRLLLRYERQVACQYDASLFVSEAEADLFKQLAPESAAKIGFFNNGVDSDYFSPGREYPDPYQTNIAAIVFTGAMDYWPNVDAVRWFAQEIFPAVLAKHPNIRFYIVGSRPTAAVQELTQLPGIVVTGAVADVRPYLAHAQLAVAPLRIARGLQNKVLEAMSMAKTVIASPQAAEGILATSGKELHIASDSQEFSRIIISILANKAEEHIGETARARILEDYNWERSLMHVKALLTDTPTTASEFCKPDKKTWAVPEIPRLTTYKEKQQ